MRTSVIVSLFLTLALGTLLGYFGAQRSAGGKTIKTTHIAQPQAVQGPLDIAPVSEEDAQQLRANHYASVRDLAGVLSLPTQFAQTEALVALVARADIDALSELINTVRALTPDTAQQRLLSILLLRFAELDAPLALEYLLSDNLDANESKLLGVLFNAWAKTDLNAALRGVQQLTHPQHIQIAGDAILQAHKVHGEELAHDIKAQLPNQYSAPRYAFTELIQRAGNAPDDAFKEALQIEDPRQRVAALQSIITIWAQQDVRAAANHMLNLQNADLKNSLLYSVTQHYVQQYPAAALEWIEANVQGRQRDGILQMAMGQMARQNPEQALSYLEKLPAGQLGPTMLLNIATAWAGKDPEAALGWLSTQDPENAANALRSIARVWAMQDPEAAGRYVESLPPESKQAWITSVADAYARRDPSAALTWLQQYNSEQGYSTALNSVLNQWANSDPQAALAYVERQPEAAKLSSAVVNSISRLAQEDTATAAAMVETMPEGPLRLAAAGALAAQWARKDAQELDNWAANLTAGPSRDRVIETLVPRLSGKPERAISLINSLQSEDARARTAMQLLFAQSPANQNQAQDLIESLDLPAARRQQLRDALRTKRATQ